jgi:DNA-binding response OmpR family regulator
MEGSGRGPGCCAIKLAAVAITIMIRVFKFIVLLLEYNPACPPKLVKWMQNESLHLTGTTRTVDVHVAWLRQNLEDNPKAPQLILTIRGLGYKFTG